MKPSWDQLAEEYSASSSVIVADVDCTVENDLCQDYSVQGYPTIKYFKSDGDEKGEDYSGGRSFEDLKKFVEDELEVKCLLDDTAGCSEKEVEFMGKWKAKPAADVTAQRERLQKMIGGCALSPANRPLAPRRAAPRGSPHTTLPPLPPPPFRSQLHDS